MYIAFQKQNIVNKRLPLFVFFLAATLSVTAQNYAEELATHRTTYVKELVEDGPLKEGEETFVAFYEPNEAYRVKCDFKPKKGGKPFELPTSSGKTKTYSKLGELHFVLAKKKYKLAVYRSLALMNNPLYKDYLFVPFKDATNGNETYGGGRYIDLRMKEIKANKEIIVDFNKAYNPYCAFANGYNCPIPPQENHLTVRIEAGEKNFQKEHE